MKILDELFTQLPDGKVLDVCVGLHWTAVVVNVEGEKRCGLASTVAVEHSHSGNPDVPEAGRLHELSSLELAGMASSEQPAQASIGIAAINALLPRQPELWRDENAEEVIAAFGADKSVALVGGFPFITRLRPRVGSLSVLELQPKGDELPADAASDILPHADVVAITSMTLINHSLESLLELCAPRARVLLLGPSTPLSNVLFECSIDLLSGAVVTDIDRVVSAVRQGANFRQVHRAGVRLVTVNRGE